MILEERDLGFRTSPEAKRLVETVFAQALDRVASSVLLVRVRMFQSPSGEVHCRARLFPVRGPTLIARASGIAATDAVHATAHMLARMLVRQIDLPRRSRRPTRNRRHTQRESDGDAFVIAPRGGRALVKDDLAEELAEEFMWAATGCDEPQAASEAALDRAVA